MQEEIFRQKIQLILDPYFDREFFTNLIYCMDRKKSIREIFEASMREINTTSKWDADLDRSLLHLFSAYQVSSMVREGYQWLPIANALYGLALQRGSGQKVVATEALAPDSGQASTLPEFESHIRREVRPVESKSSAWGSLLFLLENRTTRSQAAAALIRQALQGSDALTFEMITQGLEVSLASGWKSNATLLRRPFDRFWVSQAAPEVVSRGVQLAGGASFQFEVGGLAELPVGAAEELWRRVSEQTVEAAWENISRLAEGGASFDQIMALLAIFRGRALFGMKKEQWAWVAQSIVYGDALQAAAQLAPTEKLTCLAVSLFDLVKLVQLVGAEAVARPTGESILDGVSKNISKDRLVLRLDDSVERGERTEALELMAVILKDQGLSNSICDRLLLMAAKQDSWTFDFRTIPVAASLTKAYSACVRLGVKSPLVVDGLLGLLRFLSDQREMSLTVVPKTGTYGNGLSLSQFDVSGGARIVDRFVFNQMRNAQRIKVWPSDG